MFALFDLQWVRLIIHRKDLYFVHNSKGWFKRSIWRKFWFKKKGCELWFKYLKEGKAKKRVRQYFIIIHPNLFIFNICQFRLNQIFWLLCIYVIYAFIISFFIRKKNSSKETNIYKSTKVVDRNQATFVECIFWLREICLYFIYK